MAFWTYHQNNSGGSFEIDAAAGIGYNVVIEAPDADHANSRARRIGLYFNGCESGLDCPCCGDRWHSAYSDEGEDDPHENLSGSHGRGIPSFIHYVDGRVEQVPA